MLNTNVFEIYDECDGPESSNYTTVADFYTDLDCSVQSVSQGSGGSPTNIQHLIKDYSMVNRVKTLQRSIVDTGGMAIEKWVI